MRLDTCADVNLMPVAIYQLMFKDPSLKKLTPSNLKIETYMNDIVKIIGLCQFYLVHPENKKLIQVIFYVAKENGSGILSCRTTMALGLIKPHARLDYLPPRASLLTSTCDHPDTTNPHKPNIHHTKEKQIMRTLTHNADAHSSQRHMVPKHNRIITSKEQIIKRFPDVFKGIGKFLGKPYQIQLDPKVPPKQTPCWPITIHLKDAFKKEIGKMLKAGVLKLVRKQHPGLTALSSLKAQTNRETQTSDMFRPNKSKQRDNQRAISLQNTGGHFTLAS